MRTTLFFYGLTVALVAVGCAERTEPIQPFNGLQVIVAAQSASGCTGTNTGGRDFPVGVNRFELRLTGADVSFSAKLLPEDMNDSGEILVEGVTPGADLTLDLYGCTDGELTWSGRAGGLDVAASEKTAPRLFFTRKNDFSCTGGADAGKHGWQAEMLSPRSFHQVVTTDDGHMLLIGGFDAYIPPLGNDAAVLRVTGNAESITEYDPSRGLFRTWEGQLNSQRGLHTAVSFDNGKKVLVMGGLTRVGIEGAPFPPLFPSPEAGSDSAEPADRFELIDVATGQVSPLVFDKNPEPKPLSTIAASPNGLTIIISGGLETSEGQPSNALEKISGSVSELTSGQASVVLGAPLNQKRIGHTATFFGAGNVLILGGNFGDTAGAFDADPNHLAEVIVAETFTPTPVTVADGDIPPPIGLHQTLLVRDDGCEHDFIVSGGMELKRDAGNHPNYISPSKSLDGTDAEPKHLYVLHIDACDPAAITGQFADVAAQFDATRVRRVFHSLTALGDNLVMISGGYNQLSPPADPASAFCFTDKLESGCYLADVLLMNVASGDAGTSLSPTAVSGLSFSRSRFGHVVSVLPDGTALATGGVVADDVIDDAEIFNALRSSEADICAE